MTESERIRVRIEEPQEDTSGRTGCLTLGAILGIVAGVLFVLFGVSPLLNFLFPTETIAVGDTYQDDKLTMRVTRVVSTDTDVDPGPHQGYAVEWDVEARSSWSGRYDAFVAVLDGGQEVRGLAPHGTGPDLSPPETFRLSQGQSKLVVFFWDPEQPELPRPTSVHLEEPAVKFELPEPAQP